MASSERQNLQISVVLRQSFGIVRRRWATLAVLIVGVGYGLALVAQFGIRTGNAQDQITTALRVCRALCEALARHFAEASVVGVSLLAVSHWPTTFTQRIVAALPALVPVWLVSEYSTVSALVLWFARPWFLSHPPEFVAFTLARSLIEIIIALATVAAFAVFTPVVLEERLSLFPALGRAWHLARGARWRVVALSVMVGSVQFGLSLPLTALMLNHQQHSQVYEVASWTIGFLNQIVSGFWAVMATSIYLQLHRHREGVTAGDVSEIFA